MLDSTPPARTRTAVACQYHGCRQAAAMVELLPGPGDNATLMVSGFGATDVAEPLGDERLAHRVRSADDDLPGVLYDRDPAWAPYFCPVCERSYCVDHWRGSRCPYGH
ncbi:hypothetical protein AB0I55_05900 [Actinocatenispora sera]|nr:hypothetical protein [Actinocatenispora sera]